MACVLMQGFVLPQTHDGGAARMKSVSTPRKISRDDLVAGIAALPIGIVAGVTGVGGGEYRAPVLLSLLRNVRWTIAGNLLAGVLVGISTALLRGALSQPIDTRLLATSMMVGLPTIVAGTISSLVSLPQQIVGFLTHRQMGQTTRRTLRLAVIMGLVGVVGVGLGVALLQRRTNVTVTRILAFLMLLAAARIAWEIRSPDVTEDPAMSGASSSRDAEP